MTFDVAGEAYDRFMGRYSGPLATVFADWAGCGAVSVPSMSAADRAP